jgi:hypothetical protein
MWPNNDTSRGQDLEDPLRIQPISALDEAR